MPAPAPAMAEKCPVCHALHPPVAPRGLISCLIWHQAEVARLNGLCAAHKADVVALYNLAVLVTGNNQTVDCYLDEDRKARAALKTEVA